MRSMKKTLSLITFVLLALPFNINPAYGQVESRIKDICRVNGVRDNQLIGYGLVVGLDRTGDSKYSDFTIQSIENMLKHFGINTDINRYQWVKNVAAVMITATVPAFCKEGDQIDIVVSAIGDATSLKGGVLLQAPLLGADKNVYAVAQGPLSVGAAPDKSKARSRREGHLTAGTIPSGAIVEKEIPFKYIDNNSIELVLSSADFNTVSAVASKINEVAPGSAKAADGSTIKVRIPSLYLDNPIAFISEIEQIKVETSTSAKVVINERTGTIVMGEDVMIEEIAVSHGNLNVSVAVAQPLALADSTKVMEQKEYSNVLKTGNSIKQIVKALNTIGATPRDIISILQAIKKAGALKAELVIM